MESQVDARIPKLGGTVNMEREKKDPSRGMVVGADEGNPYGASNGNRQRGRRRGGRGEY